MRIEWSALGFTIALVATPVAWAQGATAPDEAFLKAALVIKSFDQFIAGCNRGSGFTPTDTRKIEAWQTANGVDRLRARLPELDQTPSRKKQIDQAISGLIQQLAARGVDDCAAAVRVTTTADAQFAKVSPQLLATTPQSAAPTTSAAPPQNAAPIADPASSHTELLAQIDSFAFNTRPKMGIGGFITTDIYPIVLFRNGEVLSDVEGLTFSGGIAAHKRAHPAHWTRWRRSSGELQISAQKGWEKLPFQTTYAKLPDGLRLSGMFRRLGGGGNLAAGGTDSVAVWNEYRFTADGQVSRGGGAGGRSQFGNASVATKSAAPGQRGRYRIEGLLLHIHYDDGSREQRILITDPKDPNRVVWIDGAGYVRRGD